MMRTVRLVQNQVQVQVQNQKNPNMIYLEQTGIGIMTHTKSCKNSHAC